MELTAVARRSREVARPKADFVAGKSLPHTGPGALIRPPARFGDRLPVSIVGQRKATSKRSSSRGFWSATLKLRTKIPGDPAVCHPPPGTSNKTARAYDGELALPVTECSSFRTSAQTQGRERESGTRRSSTVMPWMPRPASKGLLVVAQRFVRACHRGHCRRTLIGGGFRSFGRRGADEGLFAASSGSTMRGTSGRPGLRPRRAAANARSREACRGDGG